MRGGCQGRRSPLKNDKILRFSLVIKTSCPNLRGQPAQGVHPKIVQERLGHRSITLTLDTYSHVLPGLQEEAMKKFNIALKADQGSKQNHPI